jgi:hypothetical protein
MRLQAYFQEPRFGKVVSTTCEPWTEEQIAARAAEIEKEVRHMKLTNVFTNVVERKSIDLTKLFTEETLAAFKTEQVKSAAYDGGIELEVKSDLILANVLAMAKEGGYESAKAFNSAVIRPAIEQAFDGKVTRWSQRTSKQGLVIAVKLEHKSGSGKRGRGPGLSIDEAFGTTEEPTEEPTVKAK